MTDSNGVFGDFYGFFRDRPARPARPRFLVSNTMAGSDLGVLTFRDTCGDLRILKAFKNIFFCKTPQVDGDVTLGVTLP